MNVESFESNQFVTSDLISKNAKGIDRGQRAFADDHALVTNLPFSDVSFLIFFVV
jgi:hypothetical protein